MSSLFSAYVVEEDPQTVQSLKSTLNKLGCEVTISDGTRENVENAARNSKIDVAFVSLTFREFSGRSIARSIKSNNPFSKIFLMTSWEGELDQTILNAEGLSGVIRKPPKFFEVKKALIDHLG
jgi:CheY-like chemotaxis protein